MKGIKTKKFNDIFIRFLLSYVLILIIPMVIGIFAFGKSLQIAERDAKNSASLLLEQSKDILDSRLMEINNMVQQIAFNRKISGIVDRDAARANTFYDYWDVCRELSYYKLTNNFIDSIYLILHQENVVISDSFVSDNLPFFYKVNLKYKDMEFDAWNQFIWSRYYHSYFHKASEISRNDRTDQVITYMQSLPLSTGDMPQAVMIVLVHEKELHKLLGRLNEQEAWAYIANDRGELMTVLAKDTKELIIPPNRKDMDSIASTAKKTGKVVSYTVSDFNDWFYVAAFPSKVIMAGVNYLKMIAVFVLITALLAGVSTALFLANRNSRPMKKLAETLREAIGNKISDSNAYDFLQGSVYALIKDNYSLNEAMNTKMPFLRAAYFDRLLRGGFNTLEEISIAFSSVHIQMDYEKYVVVLAKVEGYNHINDSHTMTSLNITKLFVSEVLTGAIQEMGFVIDQDSDRIALLFCFSSTDTPRMEEDIESFAKEVRRMLAENHKIGISFGAGNPCGSPIEIFQSYHEAKEASDYKLGLKEEPMVWFGKLPVKGNLLYYPVEIESKIHNLVKAGDLAEIELVLDELYAENIRRRVLSKAITVYLFDEMRGTVIKIVSQFKTEDMDFVSKIIEYVDNLKNIHTAEEFWKGMKEVYAELCNRAAMERGRHSMQLKEDILNYINAGFTNSQMSLTLAAGHFDMNEGYFSRIFKELTGASFSQYLEEVRLAKAKQLLVETELKVHEISERVGYSSAHVFRRAYKRIHGVLPRTARDSEA